MQIRIAILLLVSSLSEMGPQAQAAEDRPCLADALALTRSSPLAQRAHDGAPEEYERYIECGELTYNLPTAAHEAIHRKTMRQGSYLLARGLSAPIPRWTRQIEPKLILPQLKVTSSSSRRYLAGEASSKDLFAFLLDELIAYTVDTELSVDWKDRYPPLVMLSTRDALASQMLFLKEYLWLVSTSYPEAWRDLLETPGSVELLQMAWSDAFGALSKACGVPWLGMRDRAIQEQVFAEDHMEGLEKVLGRIPGLPSDCKKVSDIGAQHPVRSRVDRTAVGRIQGECVPESADAGLLPQNLREVLELLSR